MKNDDKEFISKLSKKEQIKLPYKFTYQGWITTVNEKKVGFKGLNFQYYCDSSHPVSKADTWYHYRQGLAIEEVITLHKTGLSILFTKNKGKFRNDLYNFPNMNKL